MSPFTIGILGLVILFIFLFLRMPIGLALAAVGFFGVWAVRDWASALNTAATIPYSTMGTYLWTVIPLFMLMGYFGLNSGLAEEFFDGVSKWVGHFRGGLATSVIIGNTGFGACCGDQIAATVTFTAFSLPVMRRFGYNDRLTLGSVAAGAMLSGMIPPSLPFIVYGAITLTSIGPLFIGGVFPGLLLSALYIIVIYFWCLRNPAAGPAGLRATWKERWGASVGMWALPIVFVFIMGGIFLGLFTPTEAGAAGAFIVLVLALARRKFNWQLFLNSLLNTGVALGMIGFMLIGTMMFNRFLILSRVTIEITTLLTGITQSPIGFLWIVTTLYWVLGCFMNPVTILLVTLPIFYPAAMSLGIDTVQFCMVITLVLMAGTLTPPFAPSAFAIAGIVKDVAVFDVCRGAAPFLIAIIVCQALLIYFPPISLFLPSMMLR